MEMSRKMMIVAMAMVLLVVGSPVADAVISCGAVSSAMAPCIPYLRNQGPIGAGCCSGVKALNSQASTTADRQAACKCLKTAAAAIPGLNLGLAAGLPSHCGVNIPYKISPSTDCAQVR
ncbi:non-specific lipid-transfer protein 1-like [Momordica charantia]|uniref:Non-specific lipid-transfer protein n=1 Tax=Momordica charantia TaxID=3673 RepID=A0A6J1DSX2_MOMCH|nr:non-specific lipid-transfer protein 1-like [Momordica charantia]